MMMMMMMMVMQLLHVLIGQAERHHLLRIMPGALSIPESLSVVHRGAITCCSQHVLPGPSAGQAGHTSLFWF